MEIRLIELLPGTPGTHIHCKLVHSNSQFNHGSYECLSHMWGPPETLKPISVDKQSILVRPNLWAALEAVQDLNNTRKLWIDAMCINQNDEQERNSQVAMMGGIYQGAREVLIWLGEAADDSDVIFDQIYHAGPDPIWLWGDGALDYTYAKALLAICCRPYWRRVWIIQEVLGARSLSIFCGTRKMPLLPFRSVYTSFLGKLSSSLEKCDHAADKRLDADFEDALRYSPAALIWRKYKDGKREDLSLLKLLDLCSACKSECQVVHDRIYGLIGLVKSSQQGLIVPEYSKSLSQLYIDVLISLLVPDKAEDSHFISIWGSIGQNLIVATEMVQRLLEDPLWDKDKSEFFLLQDISSSSQLHQMKEIRLDFAMEGVSVISEIGPYLLPDSQFNDASISLKAADKTQKSELIERLSNLDIRNFPRAQEIGTQYRRNPSTGYFWLIDNESQSTDRMTGHSTDKCRQFLTADGHAGIASQNIQRGDLFYGFHSLEQLYRGTRDLYLIVRPGDKGPNSSFTLVGRAILLFPRPDEYSTSHFKNDLVAQGIEVDPDVFDGMNCHMDLTTLFHLTR